MVLLVTALPTERSWSAGTCRIAARRLGDFCQRTKSGRSTALSTCGRRRHERVDPTGLAIETEMDKAPEAQPSSAGDIETAEGMSGVSFGVQ